MKNAKKSEANITSYVPSAIANSQELLKLMGKDAFNSWQRESYQNGFIQAIEKKLEELKGKAA